MKLRLSLVIALFMMIVGAAGLSAADRTDPYTLDSKTHDFGTIKASNGKVSHTYTVTNISDQPIIITMVTNGGCGCTTPKWTREPIAPGESGEITVTFNPSGRKGEFKREVRARIESAQKKYTAKINFSGVIIP